MPTHDVSDAFDPSFWDTIVVNRIIETLDQHGRAVRMPTTMTAQAVVVAAGPNDLQRLPDDQYMNKAISVFSQFRLQGPVQDPTHMVKTHPDEIIWHGSTYVVVAFDDYSGYGRGFTHVVAVSISAVDGPPLPDPVGPGFPTVGRA